MVWTLQGDDFKLALVGGFVHDLKELIAESFFIFQVRYFPRDCNRVAHKLVYIGSRSHRLAPSVLTGVPGSIMVE